MYIKRFIFNTLQVNTYILYDDTHQCVIIDPGCSNKDEQTKLHDFIKVNKLIPAKLLNTHCHLDHIIGNYFVYKNFNLKPQFHKFEIMTYNMSNQKAFEINLPYKECSSLGIHLNDNDIVTYGNSSVKVIHNPGHSKGSISFYSEKYKFVISGDLIFKNSIGRTDLPGGNYKDIINSIKNSLFKLDDITVIYPGHNDYTSIGYEKANNIFLM
ncbi:MAG: MBL fold metallo-hydrolase [Bacteroides sp.]|nr:MAG: MBL fold metallo-hydrolase [Bacteroides sp.]